LTSEEFHAAKCATKTKRGNVYKLKVTADSEAAMLNDMHDARIESYQCPNCNLWHIGNKGRKDGQKRKRRNRKRRS
jgi:hypothetical protein